MNIRSLFSKKRSTPFEKLSSNTYLDDPDTLLMIEFSKGDKSAFEHLMKKYFSRVMNFIYRFTNNRDIAEELTQEVFIKVYNSGKNYVPKAKFRTWLYTIARNISLNEIRRNNNSSLSLDTSIYKDFNGYTYITNDNAEPADHNLSREEISDVIRTAISLLPKNQRIAVILRRYDNFSYEEIASTMGMSVSAVKSLLSRAREKLRNTLSLYWRGEL